MPNLQAHRAKERGRPVLAREFRRMNFRGADLPARREFQQLAAEQPELRQLERLLRLMLAGYPVNVPTQELPDVRNNEVRCHLLAVFVAKELGAALCTEGLQLLSALGMLGPDSNVQLLRAGRVQPSGLALVLYNMLRWLLCRCTCTSAPACRSRRTAARQWRASPCTLARRAAASTT